jgi:molecular chaperone HscB
MSKSESERSDTSPELGPVSACWSCQGPVAARAIFCHACGSVQPPGDTDHFSRLGLPRSFDIDPDKLEKQYLGFQRVLHPDRFVAKPARQRMIAESQAVAMNEAFQTLQDPLRRAAYLLKLHGRNASRRAAGLRRGKGDRSDRAIVPRLRRGGLRPGRQAGDAA